MRVLYVLLMSQVRDQIDEEIEWLLKAACLGMSASYTYNYYRRVSTSGKSCKRNKLYCTNSSELRFRQLKMSLHVRRL